MKNFVLTIFVISIVKLTSCNENNCRPCVKCISFDQDSIIVNEVKECNTDTAYLRDYKIGFIDGATSQNRNANCYDYSGLECD